MASAFYTWDVANDHIAWAGRFEQILGYSPSELPHDLPHWMDLVHPDDRLSTQRQWQSCLCDPSACRKTYRIRDRDGVYHPVSDESACLSPGLLIGSVSPCLESPLEDAAPGVRVGILVCDSDGRILHCSADAAAFLGMSPAEMAGRRLDDLLSGAFPASSRIGASPSAVESSSAQMAFVRQADGRCVPVTIVLDSFDARAIVTMVDFSDLEGSNRDFARFFALSLDLFCIAGFDGRFHRVNPNFSRLLGYSESQLVTQPFLDFVHPDDREATQQEMARLVDGQTTIAFRNRYRDIAGNYLWFEWTARPIAAEQLVYAVARDVTDRLLMEQRLRSQESRERAILDNTAAVIRVEDLQGRYQFVNREFARLFGVDGVSAVGQTAEQALPPMLAQQLRRGPAHSEGQAPSPAREETIQLSEEVRRTFVTSRIPLPDLTGQPSAVAFVSTDITDQIAARDARQQMQLAQTVQQKLYPERPPVIPGFEVAGLARPVTQLCGDYYDYIAAADGRCCVVVGDVSGHGLGPALQMVELRALVRTLLRRSMDLPMIFEEVNQLLCDDLPESMFISLFIAEIDPRRRSFRYLGAGHVAWLVRLDGETQQLRSTGTVLGVLRAARYNASPAFSMNSGDVLLLSTDGVTEAMSHDGELFGKDRLLAGVAALQSLPASGILEGLFERVQQFVASHPVKDDMTAIVIKATDATSLR